MVKVKKTNERPVEKQDESDKPAPIPPNKNGIAWVILFFPDPEENDGQRFGAFHVKNGFRISPAEKPSFSLTDKLGMEDRRSDISLHLGNGKATCRVFARIEGGTIK